MTISGIKSKWIKALDRLRTFSIKHSRLFVAIKFAVVFGLFFSAAWSKPYDPDFGWHLQSGNVFARSGIPAHDIFTYTATNFRWINHEWLSDILLAKLFGLGGYLLLAAVYAGLWTLSLRIVGATKKTMFLILSTLAMLPYSGVRATTWTVFLFAILLAILRNKNTHLRWGIPLLFLVWANIHGGFFIGLIVVAFFCVKGLIPMQKNTRISMVKIKQINIINFKILAGKIDNRLVSILIISILTTFINPYGPSLYEEIFRTIFDSKAHFQIAEWVPAAFLLHTMPFLFSLVWAVCFLLSMRRLGWAALRQLSPYMFLASLSSNRHFPLFVLVASYELDAYLLDIKNRFPKNLDRFRSLMLNASMAAVYIVIFWFSLNILSVTFGSVSQEDAYPVKAAEYLSSKPCKGGLFNHYNFGGYLIWKAQNNPVFVDGRIPVWKDENGTRYMDRYRAVSEDMDAVSSPDFKKYNIQCVLWTKDKDEAPVVISVKKAGWRLVDEASTDTYYLWVAP